jgi:hypothetical protein
VLAGVPKTLGRSLGAVGSHSLISFKHKTQRKYLVLALVKLIDYIVPKSYKKEQTKKKHHLVRQLFLFLNVPCKARLKTRERRQSYGQVPQQPRLSEELR